MLQSIKCCQRLQFTISAIFFLSKAFLSFFHGWSFTLHFAQGALHLHVWDECQNVLGMKTQSHVDLHVPCPRREVGIMLVPEVSMTSYVRLRPPPPIGLRFFSQPGIDSTHGFLLFPAHGSAMHS